MSVFAAIPPTATADILSGASLIYSIISALVGIILFLIWRLALEMKSDVKDLFTLHRTCRDELRKEFASQSDVTLLRKDFDDLKEDRKEKWKAFLPTGTAPAAGWRWINGPGELLDHANRHGPPGVLYRDLYLLQPD